MAEQYLKRNEQGITVKTPTGLKIFSGMSKTWHEQILLVKTSTKTLRVGIRHVFLTEDGWKCADHLRVGHSLVKDDLTEDVVTSIEQLPGEFLYDFLDVDGGSAYIADGIIHHNCEFLSSDALLISSMKLQQIAPTKPVDDNMGFKFWVPENQIGGVGKTYLVSVDPSTGSGKDFSVIEVFEFPSLHQVAEYRTNDVNIPLLYAKLKWLLNKLGEYGPRGRAEVLWTFERNGIGEAIAALYSNDDKQPEHADLYCDVPGKMGVFTSGKTKILSCLQLKQLIEKAKNGLVIKSDLLLHELKNFVAKGGSYEAKLGSTDDAVMATIGIVRLLKRLGEWNDEAFRQVNEYRSPDENDDGDEPLPMVF